VKSHAKEAQPRGHLVILSARRYLKSALLGNFLMEASKSDVSPHSRCDDNYDAVFKHALSFNSYLDVYLFS
jgi:hypothetical protein